MKLELIIMEKKLEQTIITMLKYDPNYAKALTYAEQVEDGDLVTLDNTSRNWKAATINIRLFEAIPDDQKYDVLRNEIERLVHEKLEKEAGQKK